MFPSPWRTERRNGGLKAVFLIYGRQQTNQSPPFLLEGDLVFDHRTTLLFMEHFMDTGIV